MLKIGDMAPEFNLPASGSNKVRIKDFKGKKLVIYFYPKDDTPGCTIEAKEFRDIIEDFSKKNTVILGVSKDSCASHDKFISKYNLPFTLISDEDAIMCKNYGVWIEKSMYGKKYMGIDRTTFLLDEEGKIIKIWRKVKPDGHAREVLEEIN